MAKLKPQEASAFDPYSGVLRQMDELRQNLLRTKAALARQLVELEKEMRAMFGEVRAVTDSNLPENSAARIDDGVWGKCHSEDVQRWQSRTLEALLRISERKD